MHSNSGFRRFLLTLAVLSAVLVITPVAMAAPPAQDAGPVVVINTAFLNQRTGPGPQYRVQGTLAGGTVVPLIGQSPGGGWWEVESDVGIGWVSGEYSVVRGNLTGLPVVTEYGPLETPTVIVIGYPIPVYAVPNPGGVVLGQAPGEAQFPLVGRSYHNFTETWYLRIQTETGYGWVPDDDTTAVRGFTADIPTYTTADAFALPRSSAVPGGVVNPPPVEPVPDAPRLPFVPAPTPIPLYVSGPVSRSTTSTTTVAIPESVLAYRMRLIGDCYALPLVNYLIQQAPTRATSLTCATNGGALDWLYNGRAELGMIVDGGCGSLPEVRLAALYDEAGAPHTLSFCTTAAPNLATQTFLNWAQSPAGTAAIGAYRGLAGSHVPISAAPIGQ